MEQEDLRRPFAVAPDGPARSRGVVGGYRLERMIGRGGAAEVYLARRMSDEARFAVKVVIAGSRSLADRAEVEGTIQKLLQHPNLVPVHELLKVDGLPALVMEYVEGPSLAEWLADRGPLELSEAVGLFRDILAGVRAAHAAGLVHRDLKPANILLATDAQGRVVPKVTDFGLAKLIGLRGPTMIGTAMGTPEYAAPEQGRDASSVDVRADLYALGCILYELLAGNGPFAGLDPFRLILAQKERSYRPLTEVRPDVPPALAELVDELLSYKPDQRPPDGEVVLRRLDALGLGGPAQAVRQATAWRQLLPFLLLPVIAALVGAGVALLGRL